MVHRLVLVLILFTAGAVAQQVPAEVEARLRMLEERAARAESLELKVGELESRLRTYEAAEDESRLETAVNALIAQEGSASVTARKAKAIVLGGQIRLRTEYRSINRYQDADPKDSDKAYAIERTRVNIDARVLDDFRAFVELQDSRQWGEEMTVLTDVQGVDLHQGFVDFEKLFGSPLTLRTGRFELSLWNQRLVSPLDWHPVGRAWDGANLFGRTGDVELWGGYQLIAQDPSFTSGDEASFASLAATYRGLADHVIGAAFFWTHNDVRANDDDFGTATAHAQGKFDAFDYSADGVIQFGSRGDRDVWAYAWALTAGWTFDAASKPRLGVEWTYATGDDDPDDGDYGTFDPLFPFGHTYQGYLDFFAWKNGHDVVLHFELKPAEAWWAELAVHSFWLDTTQDAWYGALGQTIRAGGGADSEHVGYELDLSGKYWFSKDVWLWFGYSHFFTGEFVDETGADPDADWVWVQLTANF